MITLLIRCSYRPEGFRRTLSSIPPNITIICSYDDERALTYIPEYIHKIRVYKHEAQVWYDNYCNDLKSHVHSGYFAFLDEGDTILPGSLKLLSKHLRGSKGVICQFSRNGRLKPDNILIENKQILRGRVGMPCLFLHSDYASLVDFDGSVPAADYHWIKAISRKIRLKFIPLPVVHADKRDGGVMED